jgi:hypothetical protein
MEGVTKLPLFKSRKKDPPLEALITKAILKDINQRPGWRAKKLHGNAFSAGWPDILAVYRGRAVFLEVKRPLPWGKVTPLQQVELEAWEAVGALAEVVRSVEDARAILAYAETKELII